jgi:hypothetical protein
MKRILIVGLLAAACTRKADSPQPSPSSPAWPQFPAGDLEVEQLIARATSRPVPENPAAQAVTLEAVLAKADKEGFTRFPAGEGRIVAWLQAWIDRAGAAQAFLLVGGFHDSGVQAEVFRHWFGPSALRGLSHVVLEQLPGDGRWQGLPLTEQRGETALCERFARTGDAQGLTDLQAALTKHAYTAWKYGYLSSLRDLFLDGRAMGVPVLGCDLPGLLQRRLGGELLRLRELHCVQVLRQAAGRQPLRATLFWGIDHVRPAGLRRFLPTDAQILSVYLFGARNTPDPQLAKAVTLNDPVLVPLGPSEAAVLLPDRTTEGSIDRVRTHEPVRALSPTRLRVSSTVPARFSIQDRSFPIDETEVKVDLPAADYTYSLRLHDGRQTIGSLHVPVAGETCLEFSDGGRAARIVESSPEL